MCKMCKKPFCHQPGEAVLHYCYMVLYRRGILLILHEITTLQLRVTYREMGFPGQALFHPWGHIVLSFFTQNLSLILATFRNSSFDSSQLTLVHVCSGIFYSGKITKEKGFCSVSNAWWNKSCTRVRSHQCCWARLRSVPIVCPTYTLPVENW